MSHPSDSSSAEDLPKYSIVGDVSIPFNYRQALPVYLQGDRDERDPNGLKLKQPGAKADSGKVCVTRGCLHYFPRALTAIAELSTIGARKYSWKGWASVPDGINRYGDALGRHELQIEGDFTRRDPDTGVLEAAAVAWNALARLELILQGDRDE